MSLRGVGHHGLHLAVPKGRLPGGGGKEPQLGGLTPAPRPLARAMNAGVSLLAASDSDGRQMLTRVELALNQSRELGADQVVVR